MRENPWKVPPWWTWQPLITTGNQKRVIQWWIDWVLLQHRNPLLTFRCQLHKASPRIHWFGPKTPGFLSLPQTCSPVPASKSSLPITGPSILTTDPLPTLWACPFILPGMGFALLWITPSSSLGAPHTQSYCAGDLRKDHRAQESLLTTARETFTET